MNSIITGETSMDLPIGFNYTELTIIKAALESELGDFLDAQSGFTENSQVFIKLGEHIKQREKIIETIEKHFIKYKK